MSLQRKDCLNGSIGIPWKNFVRESCEFTEKPPEKKIHHLGFQGNEAKASYEEIINQESSATPQVGKQRYPKSRALSSQPKKNGTSEETNVNVTINTILKAVEQKDLKFLLKHVTLENVNLTDDYGWTPLMSAAYCGHLDIIEYLLSVGANRRAREKSGLTAAQLALKKNYLSIVALLKKKVECSNGRVSAESPMAGLAINTDVNFGTRLESTEPLKDHNGCTSRNSDPMSKNPDTLEKKGFYCEICEASFRHATPKKHETSTLHIFNSKPKLPSAMYGISKHNKGYQMLLNTGWDEQAGLGPSGNGMKYPLKTCLKTDRKGLGQTTEKDYRVTHFKPGDTNAIVNFKVCKQKGLKKRDREKLLNREAKKERALRIALS